jgi:hypothetical protein
MCINIIIMHMQICRELQLQPPALTFCHCYAPALTFFCHCYALTFFCHCYATDGRPRPCVECSLHARTRTPTNSLRARARLLLPKCREHSRLQVACACRMQSQSVIANCYRDRDRDRDRATWLPTGTRTLFSFLYHIFAFRYKMYSDTLSLSNVLQCKIF